MTSYRFRIQEKRYEEPEGGSWLFSMSLKRINPKPPAHELHTGSLFKGYSRPYRRIVNLFAFKQFFDGLNLEAWIFLFQGEL